MKLIPICAALAVGEGLALLQPAAAEIWPVPLALAVFALLFGYGFSVRGWPYAAVLLLGASLALFASVNAQRSLHRSPWLRQRAVRRPSATVSAFPSVRRDFSRRVGLGLDRRSCVAALNRAILLGERGRMPPELKRTFVESGTIHVFAISGLHVMVVAKMLMVVLLMLFCPLRWAGVAALPPLWAYVALIGSPPSAVRAALMASFHFVAPVFWRRDDALRAWALTFLAVHLSVPTALADVGSVLSFSVMLAIILACRCVRRGAKGLAVDLWVAFAAWAVGTPIAAHVFGRVTPGGLVANLVMVTAAGYSVLAGAVGLLASFVSESVAGHLNNLAALLTELMVVLADGVSRLPGASLEVRPWGWVACGAWYGALAFLFFAVRAHARRRDLI